VAEITTPKFERTVARQSGSLEVATRVADRDLAVLTIKPTKNGLRVGLRGRELAQGQSLASRASTSRDPLAAVARHPEVEAAVGTGNAVLVRLRGGKDWVKLTPGARGIEARSAGVARVADTRPGAHPYDVAFVEGDAVKAAVHGGEDVVIRVPERAGEGTIIRVTARGPPPEGPSVTVEIEGGGGTIRGRFDPETRTLMLARDDIPPALLDEPARLAGLIKNSGVGKLKAESGKMAVTRLAAKEVSAEESAFVRDLGEGRYGPAAGELASDPAGFARKADAEYQRALGHSDRLLEDGSHERAFAVLDQLEDVYGARPEIRFRRAICEIDAGRPARAARFGNEAFGTSLGPMKLHEEINARLASSDLDASTRSDLSTFRDAAAWRDLQASGRLPVGDVKLAGLGERVALDLHALQPLPKGNPVPLDRVFAPDAIVYVMDTPSLNNLDWDVSFRTTLESQVQGRFADVVSIPDVGIAEFSPARIFAGEPAAKVVTYMRVRTGTGSRSASPYHSPAASGGGNSDDEEEKRRRKAALEAEKKRIARLLALANGEQTATGEVYLVIPAGTP
jgi:hypothetical protein